MTAGTCFFWVGAFASSIGACVYAFPRPGGRLARDVWRIIRALVPLSLGMFVLAILVGFGASDFRKAFAEFHPGGSVSVARGEYFALQTITTVGYGFEVLPDADTVKGERRARMLERFYRISSWYMVWGPFMWAVWIGGVINLIAIARRIFSERIGDRQPEDAGKPAG